MKIIVTPHSVEQYKKKSRNWDAPHEALYKYLTLIAERGSITRRCPGGAHEVTYNGDAIVVEREEQRLIIITYLGDKKYRNWFKKNEINPRYARAI